MFTASTKKQNRVLLITLIVLLLSAALLVAITGGANKKTTDESNPPIESSKTESGSSDDNSGNKIIEKADESENASDDVFGSRDKTESTDETSSDNTDKSDDKSAESSEESKKSSAETEEDVEVSVSQSSVLPNFVSPVSGGVVLKGFSGTTPVFSYTMNDYRTHRGVDFACSAGTPVYAAAEGVICEIDDDPMMGVTISIEHSGGAVTRYMGLAEDSLDLNSIGDSVYCGQVIGASGDTALIESAEEAHVHFELTVNGEVQDPAEYMDVTFISDIHEG